MWKESRHTHTRRHKRPLADIICKQLRIQTISGNFCKTHSHKQTCGSSWEIVSISIAHTHTHRSCSPSFPFRPALEHGQAKAHFSRGDALSSRGVHMKEQQNIKECPRIHCSAQCEDNLALMENLDQRPGLHNCTFPNKHCAIEPARPPDS